MADAQDLKKFSFVSIKSPSTWGVVALVVFFGLIAGIGAQDVLTGRLLLNPYLFTVGFIALNLLSGFFVGKLVSNFKDKWSYLTVLVNQVSLMAIAYIFLFSTRITLLDSLVLWTAMAYTVWMLLLSGLGAVRIGLRSISLSMIQPILVWLLMLVSIHIVDQDMWAPLIFMLGSIVFSTLVILFTEHVFSLVFTGMSGLAELSKVLKGIRGEQVSLGIGHNINALLQYLKFKMGGRESLLVAPWLHSGPIRSVGGGNLSTQCIEKLNRAYGPSYFLHVPSNHEYNPSMDISARIVKAVEGADYKDLSVSRPVRLEESGITVIGQKLNDTYLISLASSHIDDYDISIFSALRDKYEDGKVLFVDSHPNVPLAKCSNVEAFTREAVLIEKLIDAVIQRLEKEKLSRAKVGTAIQQFGQYTVFAMVLKAEETMLYFVVDTNGLQPVEMHSIKKIAGKLGIDYTMFFTTDTHSLTVKALIARPDTPTAIIESTIKKAAERLEPAKFSYGESLLENVRILGKTYYELLTVVKIMSRVTPVLFSLFFLFLAVLLWIF